MADLALLLAIAQGKHDEELAEIAGAVAQRVDDLTVVATMSQALAAYAELTGVSLHELSSLNQE